MTSEEVWELLQFWCSFNGFLSRKIYLHVTSCTIRFICLPTTSTARVAKNIFAMKLMRATRNLFLHAIFGNAFLDIKINCRLLRCRLSMPRHGMLSAWQIVQRFGSLHSSRYTCCSDKKEILCVATCFRGAIRLRKMCCTKKKEPIRGRVERRHKIGWTNSIWNFMTECEECHPWLGC